MTCWRRQFGGHASMLTARAICNGWVTGARHGVRLVRSRVFWCAGAQDSLAHYRSCVRMFVAEDPIVGRAQGGAIRKGRLFPAQRHVVLRTVVFHHLRHEGHDGPAHAGRRRRSIAEVVHTHFRNASAQHSVEGGSGQAGSPGALGGDMKAVTRARVRE